MQTYSGDFVGRDKDHAKACHQTKTIVETVFLLRNQNKVV